MGKLIKDLKEGKYDSDFGSYDKRDVCDLFSVAEINKKLDEIYQNNN